MKIAFKLKIEISYNCFMIHKIIFIINLLNYIYNVSNESKLIFVIFKITITKNIFIFREIVYKRYVKMSLKCYVLMKATFKLKIKS